MEYSERLDPDICAYSNAIKDVNRYFSLDTITDFLEAKNTDEGEAKKRVIENLKKNLGMALKWH